MSDSTVNIPPVQYVTTPDGTHIAFTVSGRGPAFVFLPTFLNHAQDAWRKPNPAAHLLLDLTNHFQVVNFDSRGMGLSTRGLTDELCLESYLSDLESVLERLNLKRAVLLGSCQSCLLGAHYAARHPERIPALILVNGALSWEAWRLSSIYDRLPEEDWDLFLRSLISQAPEGEHHGLRIDNIKDRMTQSDYLKSASVWHTASLERILPELRMPILVLHSREFRLRSIEAPLELARILPNARLALMDSWRLFGEPGQALEEIERFLSDLELWRRTPSPSVLVNEATGPLTVREMEVLRLLADGNSNRDIAEALALSLRTVERHITNIYGKIHARGRADATAYALRTSLI